MGFRYFNYGNIHPCKITNRKVITTLASGVEVSYGINLDVEIPEQLNYYTSNTIVFYLVQDGIAYIGRKDMTVSVVRESDNLLMTYTTWNFDPYPDLQTIGYFGTKYSIFPILLDNKDKRTMYIPNRYTEHIHDVPLEVEFDPDRAENFAMIHQRANAYHIVDKEGRLYDATTWSVQNFIGKSDYRSFV